ncbi:tetraacyldisaccharide 4'-kinase [Allorhizobium sp. BGMRC 0089]|uniref:tetraacyldisaccharide 4'-kinase n=1 Tax=Allorhizobium sonneratiae TaxID=2934936 RepID=UPI002033EED8|nr:tetraacyldisaccharide 4'-kinase [Allorhizobium sonneratiae]MCM2291318.1 tetraacyldisaccharide 4'-kinase [Allorhizobium sonneratiae]
MALKAPAFWWRKPGLAAFALQPLCLIYGRISGQTLIRRMASADQPDVNVPVICIGNLTLGGAGKTPTTLALARTATAMGLKPGFLTRGYGGKVTQAHRVDPQHNTAVEVGDEALLLAQAGLTVAAPDRAAGAQALIRAGADLILMDDGFQSARLFYDFAVIVADARQGIGNGHVFPAGPLRAPLAAQLAHVGAFVLIGEGDGAGTIADLGRRADKPVFSASIRPVSGFSLRQKRVLAFAGIADPEKFYRTLAELGAEIVTTRSFGDHQPFSAAAMADLLDTAKQQDLTLVTTAKDRARLSGLIHPDAKRLIDVTEIVEIDLVFSDPNTPQFLIETAMTRYRQRQI